MLKYSLYLMLLLAGTSTAQSFKPFTVGVLQCGLVKRGVDTIQLYCYGPAPTCDGCDTARILYTNSIHKVYSLPSDDPGLRIPYGYGMDQLELVVNIVGNGMYYQVVGTGAPVQGVFIDTFASLGSGCGLPVNLPHIYWGDSSRSCVTAWNDAWLDCCVGL